VDKPAGYLIYQKIDDTVIKQSKFYAFNNGFLPGHIERWTGATILAEIDSNITVKTEFPSNYFDYPANATIKHACTSFTPAFSENTPQAAAKSVSEGGIDIVVHGFVSKEGKPTGLKVLDATHQDLAEEAVSIVSGWTFRPAQCNYQPASQQRDFIVHFQGAQ
jgi:TonB-like protein